MTDPSVPSNPPVSPSSSLTDIGLSVVRTFVPAIVGAIVTVFTRIGAHVDSGSIDVAITTIVTAVYYSTVRILETKIGPRFGWLLGAPKAPTY